MVDQLTDGVDQGVGGPFHCNGTVLPWLQHWQQMHDTCRMLEPSKRQVYLCLDCEEQFNNGTKAEMLSCLRVYAKDCAKEDRARQRGRAGWVESSLEGKTRNAIADNGSFDRYDDGKEEARGYFYYAAVEATGGGGGGRGAPPPPTTAISNARRKSPLLITAPVPPDVVPNAKGERVVTIYSTLDRNNLTSMMSQPSVADFLLDGASQYDQRRKGTAINDTLLRGEQESAGPRRHGASRARADNVVVKQAKREVSKLLGNLLATTGAPAFQDDYEDVNDDSKIGGGRGGGRTNLFALPYGYVGFDPDRILPDVLSASSPALRAGDGRALWEVLSNFELHAIGHNGYNANNRLKGGDTTR
jgi:hypothetical protein